MKRNVIAIVTTIQRRTHYVRAENELANGEIAPELTIKTSEMKEYDSHEQAQSKIDRLRDPFDREYRVENISVWHKKPVVARSMQPADLH